MGKHTKAVIDAGGDEAFDCCDARDRATFPITWNASTHADSILYEDFASIVRRRTTTNDVYYFAAQQRQVEHNFTDEL